MKWKTKFLASLVFLSSLFFTQGVLAAEAAETDSSSTKTEVISVDGVLVDEAQPQSPIQTLGAGQWDNIGTYTFSKVIRISSGGGDLKACIHGTTKVTLGLEKAPVSLFDKHQTTSGVSGDNCAIWRDISSGTYDLGLVSHYGQSFTVTIYD